MRKIILLSAALVMLVFAAGRYEGVEPGEDTGASKHVVLVHETSKDTPEIGEAIVNLRDGAAAKHFVNKGVYLEIIDADALNESGKRVVDAFIGVTKIPAVFFFEKRSGKLKYSESLGNNFTADSVVAIAKKHGA